ncbi:DUF6851 domain-containing protein [Micromonospora sp. NPDC000442]|uniref:vanadium-dependent haloperoxidase n=1 Tax=Micromonospora sp. NPDC000442 TaxID=3364217 RepID=UPI00369074E3
MKLRNSGIGAAAALAAVTLVLSGTPALASGRPDRPRPAPAETVVVRWNNLALDSVTDAVMGPPVAARALAIIHTCIYDAWAAYDTRAAGTRFGTRLRRPAAERTSRNKEEAISYAAFTAATDLWPDSRARAEAVMRRLGYPLVGRSTASRVGVRACRAVLTFRHHDGANQLGDLAPGAYTDYTGYQPANEPMVMDEAMDDDTMHDPNHWQPLMWQVNGVPEPQTFIAPQWNRVARFAQRTKLPVPATKPPARSGSRDYARQAGELVSVSAHLTDREKAIAEYWADEGKGYAMPPGTWARVAQFISHRDRHTIDQDAKLFFAVTNAVFEASIDAWSLKRQYDYVRPISAVRYVFRGTRVPTWAPNGRGSRMIDGGTWMPYQPAAFGTPPFAEFPSGHSTFGAAATEVLRSFTGSDRYGGSTVVRAGSSRVEPGTAPRRDVVLTWATFTEADKQNSMSRLIGGVHFRHGVTYGRSVGHAAGVSAWREASLYFAGVADPAVQAGGPVAP